MPFHIDGEEGVSEEVRDWFQSRRISYFHDQEKGMVFLQMCSTKCPAMRGAAVAGKEEKVNSGLDSVIDELEVRELQGLLFMFSVCHVVIYIQEGSRFDTQVLKSLRTLQSAKHALMPFLRSHNILPSVSRPSSSSSRPPAPAISSKSPSPRRGSGVSSRNSSSISVMSGLGLYTALFPGQCTPVTLFAFIDDFSDIVNASAVAEESVDSSLSNQSALSNMGRSNMAMKGSSSVVVLSRPSNKCEGCLRKKLHCSLESQIRFLIKKCRTLSVFESSSHGGSRSGAYSGLAPLLTLDASKAVMLLDNSCIKQGKSLDFATGLVEEVLNGKVTSDSLLLESHGQTGNKQDIMTLKEFIFRQADILRGKGGVVTNANNITAGGVGMVAVAAAAAAASAASGRSTTVPELPSLEVWLSSSQLILKGILSAKRGSADETEIIRRKLWQRNGTPAHVERVNSKDFDTPESAVSLLESSEGINRKFSAVWCQKVLPAAMEVYLKDLPPCYPTLQHESQMERAIHAFYLMVKGPSVQLFMTKLEKECLSNWKSGRQLCDAISLTGRPCMHQRHDAENDGCPSDAMGQEHSSEFVFLHACACGRSHQLRPDPFDFESANITFNIFPDCDKLLPMLQLPKMSDNGTIHPFSWTVVRLGGAKYYDPSKGLLQPGFSSNYKFLLRWTIILEKDKRTIVSFANALMQGSLGKAVDIQLESTMDENARKSVAKLEQPDEMKTRVEKHEKDDDNCKSDKKKISFGKGLPNITMRKAFSEVVAGSASSNSAFPPLQSKMQPSFGQEKGVLKNKVGSMDQINISTGDVRNSKKSEENPSAGGENLTGMSNVGRIDCNPFLQIGSNVVPLNVDDARSSYEKNTADGWKARFDPSFTHFVVYVGFEHECPCGHRFLLSPELMNQLGHVYSLPEESHGARSMEHDNRRHRGPMTMGKSDGHSKGQQPSNANATFIRMAKNLGSSGQVLIDSDPAANAFHMSKPVDQTAVDSLMPPESVRDIRLIQHCVKLDNNGPAFSLLNRNLPIYLNCPHCSACKSKKDLQSLNFAGTISQLQRIFVVTPPFPIVLATNPVVQFEGSCQPSVVSTHEDRLQFSLGCKVILPPESFVSLRLPFVYGVEVKDKGLLPLNPFEIQPELTAWIKHGTVLQMICQGSYLE